MSLKPNLNRLLIPIIFVLEVVLLLVTLVVKWNPGTAFPSTTTSFPISTFFSLGVVLTVTGILIAFLSFHEKKAIVSTSTGTYETSARDSSTQFPMFGLIQPIHHSAELIVEFEETEGKGITVYVQDLITSIGAGHYITTYGTIHRGAKGYFREKLSPGKYDIYFMSTDTASRKVKLNKTVISPSLPFRTWREVGLTLVTVGTFFLFEASLKIFG